MTRKGLLTLSLLLALPGFVQALPPEAEDPGTSLRNWTAPPYWVPPESDGPGGVPEEDARERTISTLALPTNPLPFVAVTPCRIVNTRRTDFPTSFGAPALIALTERTFVLPNGPCAGLPADAGAWSLNITVVPAGIATIGGYLSVYPAGGARPVVSTLNFVAGGTAPPVANAAIVPAGPGGAITVFPSDATHLLIDVNGYYSSQGVVTSLTTGASTLTGPVTLAEGSNVTLTPSGQTVTIAASSGPGGQLPVGSAGHTLRHSGSAWVADGLLYNDATKIGIGTTSPTEQLTLTGNLALPAAGSLKLGGTTFLSSPEVNSTFVGMGGALNRTTGVNNTAFGNMALFSMSTGSNNTAVGMQALRDNTIGGGNVGLGLYALASNKTASQNTAVGTQALYSQSFNNGGVEYPTDNTGIGYHALYANQPTSSTSGNANTAVGSRALAANGNGRSNTAVGSSALAANTTGLENVALGDHSLSANLSGGANVAIGVNALRANQGHSNTAVGAWALTSSMGFDYSTAVGDSALALANGGVNTALGFYALRSVTSGSNNLGLGTQAGLGLQTGSGNIYVGSYAVSAAEAETIRIGYSQTATYVRGIFSQTASSGVAVYVNSAGKLGTTTSSRRYKQDIADMAEESDVLMKLRPVVFRYRPEHDSSGDRQYGLVAEEVAEVAPQLVVFSPSGEVETVRYHFVNALLLNEVQKQRKAADWLSERVEALEAERAEMRGEMEGLREAVRELASRLRGEEKGAD